MSPTLEEVNSYFQESCQDSNLLFIPSVLDDNIIDNVMKYCGRNYPDDPNIIYEIIDYFLREQDGLNPVTLQEFAAASVYTARKVEHEVELKNEFDELVRQTKDRMRGFDEL